jgi:hypothetical protein
MSKPKKPKHEHGWIYYELGEELAEAKKAKYLAVCILDLADINGEGCIEKRYETSLPPGYRPLRSGEAGFVYDPPPKEGV